MGLTLLAHAFLPNKYWDHKLYIRVYLTIPALRHLVVPAFLCCALITNINFHINQLSVCILAFLRNVSVINVWILMAKFIYPKMCCSMNIDSLILLCSHHHLPLLSQPPFPLPFCWSIFSSTRSLPYLSMPITLSITTSSH